MAPLRCSVNYTQTFAITLLPYSFKEFKRWVLISSLNLDFVIYLFRSAIYFKIRQQKSLKN